MSFLLDTHVLLWALGQPERLPARTRSLLADRSNQLAFSAASLCEIAIKARLDRPDFRADPSLVRRELIDLGFEDVPVLSSHAVAVASLPPIHKDPFDRLLIAQAIVEGVTLLTADALVLRYPGPIQRV